MAGTFWADWRQECPWTLISSNLSNEDRWVRTPGTRSVCIQTVLVKNLDPDQRSMGNNGRSLGGPCPRSSSGRRQVKPSFHGTRTGQEREVKGRPPYSWSNMNKDTDVFSIIVRVWVWPIRPSVTNQIKIFFIFLMRIWLLKFFKN